MRKDWDAWDPMLISEGLFSAANIFRLMLPLKIQIFLLISVFQFVKAGLHILG